MPSCETTHGLMPPRECAFDHLYPLLIARDACAEFHHLLHFGKFALHQPYDTAGEVKVVDSVHRSHDRSHRAVVIAASLCRRLRWQGLVA
jgi:hypothetical protein